jgi:enoyl-CoA hydratase/carnithine racemase
MNALDDAMFEALIETGAALAADPGVRAVVLSGEGRAFCAGLDMGNFGRMANGGGAPGGRARLAERTHGIANRAQQAVWAWRLCPAPVIAAVHGVAFGGGFQLALGADIRIVHPETRMSIMEVKWGLVPDMGGTPMMRALAREDVVRELCYTGRIFSGGEALGLGFATRVSADPHGDALALGREIAGRSPDAVRGAKEILNALGDADDADALLRESVVQDRVIGRPNQVEAVMAALEKRAPRFANPA